MDTFFYIAGVTVTILGILAIIAVSFAFIWVRVLGYTLHLYYKRNDKRRDKHHDK